MDGPQKDGIRPSVDGLVSERDASPCQRSGACSIGPTGKSRRSRRPARTVSAAKPARLLLRLSGLATSHSGIMVTKERGSSCIGCLAFFTSMRLVVDEPFFCQVLRRGSETCDAVIRHFKEENDTRIYQGLLGKSGENP